MASNPPGATAAVERARAAESRQIGGRAIRRGFLLNVVGAVAPALAALVCIPVIVAGLGNARFGVLSLAWVFINSIGILDLGIGRALTRFLAVREEPDASREASMVWTSLASILALGGLAGAAVWWFADPLAASLAHGDATLRLETASALRILATSVPLVMLSSGQRGVLEAFGRFDLTNRVSIPITVLNLALPAVLLHLGASLLGIVSALVLLRIVGTLLLIQSVIHVVPAMRVMRLRAAGMGAVLVFGGWVTVSYVPGPLFAQADRYFLGSLAALSAVAFYSTPADVLSRVTVIPGAVIQVLFPVLAQALSTDRARAARLANRAILLIAAAVLPVVTVLVAVAPEALELWLGPEFASHGARAGRIIALATFMNCMDWLAFSVVQSAGFASWTGKLRALEIPLHLALAASLIHAAGIDGAAVATLLRATVDGAVLVWMATRVLGPSGRVGRLYALLVALGVVTLAGAAAPVALALRLGWSVVALAAGGAMAWRLLDAEAREALSSRAAAAWARVGVTS
ncbi:MAG TPA: oligosaccharide flippase family protein [Anaeromyxobacter sp.]